MKNLVLKSIALTNFRGHKETKVEFNDLTTISGDNATGKSTIFEAFLWLLFGKDQFDRKDYEIIPTVNGKMLERVDSNVTALVQVDGREIELSRTLHQKWVRRRGTAEEVFDGCETLYTWDGLDIKAGEYKSRIDLLVEESIFKLITNPSAFLSLHWTKQREFLFQMAGGISDGEILDRMATLSNKDAIFNLTNILNQGKKLSEFKTEIRTKKKKAKEELDDIQPRIDQTTKLMPANRDFAAIEFEIEAIDKKIIVIDCMVSDRSKAINGQYDAIQEKQRQINDLKTNQQQAVNAAQQQRQQEAFTLNQDRAKLENEVGIALRNVKNAETARDQAADGLLILRKKLEAKAKEIEQLRADWETENAKEYKAQEGCFMCPVFGHACSDSTAAAKHVEAQEKAKSVFLSAKYKNLDELDEVGTRIGEEIKTLEGRICDGETYLADAASKVSLLSMTHDNLKKSLSEMAIATPHTVVASELPEWQELEKQIKDIEANIQTVQPVDNSDLNTKKAELNQRRDELKAQLSDRDIIARHKAAIAELEARGKELSQQIANLEGQEFTIDAFNKFKIDECDRRINRMFGSVRFQLFDKTLDGNEFETCIPTNPEGVRYDVTNTAEQINMGLDAINTLSQFYNVKAPIFVDHAESINQPITAGSQMILIKVTAPGTLFCVS